MPVSERFKKALWFYVVGMCRRDPKECGKFKEELMAAKPLAEVVAAMEKLAGDNEFIIKAVGKAHDLVESDEFIAGLENRAPHFSDEPFTLAYDIPPEKKPTAKKKKGAD